MNDSTKFTTVFLIGCVCLLSFLIWYGKEHPYVCTNLEIKTITPVGHRSGTSYFYTTDGPAFESYDLHQVGEIVCE